LIRAIVAAVLLWITAAWGAEVALHELPSEARSTLELVKAGGPFAYPQDGRVFSNREGLLPMHKRGYYREYTVRTPGVRDRGARRIVAGRPGEYYYTDDHYRSFRRILE
jgi:ribonuclease T1